MTRETYVPDQFRLDEVIVDPNKIYEVNGAVRSTFQPDYTDGVCPDFAGNSSRWKVRGDLGDLSGRGEPVNQIRWPNRSRIAVITPVTEDFPRNA